MEYKPNKKTNLKVSTAGYPIKRVNSEEYKLNQNSFDPYCGSPPNDSFMDKLKNRENKYFTISRNSSFSK
tara:strand:- start:238 stop:447 length:210 start_codon:yes stop_codon:yes gene_type:complete